jgi:predicted ATP-grasp superfamily ATP-dependent carboligase
MTASPNLDASYPALLLRASSFAVHHGALAAVRTLGTCGVPVYAALDDRLTPLTASRHLTRLFRWERWPRDVNEFVAATLRIGELIGRPTLIIPIDDLSAALVAENATHLRGAFLLPSVAPQLPRLLSNKATLHALCTEHGVPAVAGVTPRTIDDVRAFADRSTFPVMIKAAEQWLLMRSQINAKRIRTRAELLALFDGVDPAQFPRTVLQEYVPGADWICHGYFNAEKGLSLTFTGRKLRGYPAGAGSTAVGLTVPNEALAHEAERFLGVVRYSGIIDMDWRWDERDGNYRLVDCNPRIGQNFRMFETSAGIDVVRAQHLDLTGRLIPRAPMIEGRLFTVESYSLLGALRRIGRRSKESLVPLPRSAPRERAWWSLRDPLPFAVMVMRLPAHVASVAWRRLAVGLRRIDGD